MKAGDHAFNWNGKDTSGKQLDDGGPYTLKVTAKDSAGTAVISKISIQGVVTGVEQVDGKTLITINGAKIPWEAVTSINNVVAPITKTQNDNTPVPDTEAAA